MKKPVVDYSSFRPGRFRETRFAHLKLLLFWPLYALAFVLAERWIPRTEYHMIFCRADAWIPFCEWFLIPYVFWYFYIPGMIVYTLLYDVESFRKLMQYLILTTAAAFAVFLLFPNCQNMRPELFADKNLLVSGIRFLYTVDTPTNVFPSLHVMHAFAVSTVGIRTKGLESRGWVWFFGMTTGLICLSTVFIKQHSILDGAAGLVICLAAEWICYGGKTWENCLRKKTA